MEVNNKSVNDINDVVLLSLLLKLNRFPTLLYFFAAGTGKWKLWMIDFTTFQLR